jgi:hypothetical protein
LTLPAAAAASNARVIARKFVRKDVGAYVRASSGEAIFVPPYVMSRSGDVTITSVGRGVYDIHVGPSWHGTVAVSLPVHGKENAIIHDVGGVWLTEGSRLGEGTVWVTQLSLLTTIVNKVKNKNHRRPVPGLQP